MAATVAAPPVRTYPVHVDALPVPDQPSRWLWLVKWVLLVPHVVVLVLLWMAFAVLSVVAFVAILVTGVYPRAIFDFNVGVLRWSWRVTYYGYGALGTDTYPPFTLDEVADYPAHLDVDYPQHLSRGLVLVKWWLLALPHYLVLAVLVGAGTWIGWETEGRTWQWQGGLVELLALLAGLTLLFVGVYPRGLYDLLLGLNRWVLRVTAYAGLMTDVYPPFRLDQGGPDARGGVVITTAPDGSAPEGAARSAASSPSTWSAGRVTAVVAGAFAVVTALGLLLAGGALLAGHAGLREAGFVTSPERVVSTTGYAVATEEMLLEGAALDVGLGEVRVRAELPEGQAVFIGIAAAPDAAAYLAGVDHAVVTGPRAADVRAVDGGAPTSAPGDADIWLASATGTGTQVLEATPTGGRWVAVVMRSDGAAGVQATVDVGATLPWLRPHAASTLFLAAVILTAGLVFVGLAIRAAGRPVVRPARDPRGVVQ